MDVRLKQRGVPIAVVVLGAIALAACGSSGSTAKGDATTSSTASPSTTGSPQTTASGPAVVKTADNAKFGTLLVDADGKTLYTLTAASGDAVACTGQCATFWPPLLLPAGTTTATGSAGVTGLGTADGAGGTQVTENGSPLYRFAADAAAGDANGEGISSFGGTWHVVKSAAVSGSGTTQTTVAPAPTATTVDPYGY
jgi:predicted lipoprotein with Yx(FWY)xxD motif